MRLKTPLHIAAVFAMAVASPAFAADPVQQHNSNAVWFENWTGLSNGLLKVVAPNGELTEVFAPSGTPVFELSGREVLDGIYRYELSAAGDEQVAILNKVDNGRGDAASDTQATPFYTSGVFVVSRGVIVKPEEIKEEG